MHVGIGKNVQGEKAGRLWIHREGNINAMICFPKHIFKYRLSMEFFPYLAPFGVRDVCNKYSNDSYIIKSPNDLVCKEHMGKTAGFVCRRQGKFIIAYFGCNRYSAPPQNLLRNEGLTACCLANHCKPIPKVVDFIYECATHILELGEKYHDIDPLMEYVNNCLAVYPKKFFRFEVNNRNADIDKDGLLMCKASPNALFKGFLTGVPYDVRSYLFDDNLPTTTDTSNEEIKKVYELLKEEKEKEKANKGK